MLKRIFHLILILLCFLTLSPAFAADNLTATSENGYLIYIEDNADLLTESEQLQLIDDMRSVASYTNVAFYTTTQYQPAYEQTYADILGERDGICFIIDMEAREIFIYANGEAYKKIDKRAALQITANTYKYATRMDYYECARVTFEQINIYYKNGHIFSLMKILSNLFCAVSISFLIVFLVIYYETTHNINDDHLLIKRGKKMFIPITGKHSRLISVKERAVYSGGSSGGGSFSGGSGGGSSGGGGGHSF